MICLNIYRHFLQNIQWLTSVPWVSHQVTGRTNHSGALKAKVNIKMGWLQITSTFLSWQPSRLNSLVLEHELFTICSELMRQCGTVTCSLFFSKSLHNPNYCLTFAPPEPPSLFTMLKSGVVLFLYHYELVPIPLSLCDLPLFPAVPPYCGFRRLKRKRQNGISR